MSKKIPYPAKRIPASEFNKLVDRYPSAGPRPNVSGMRKMYWGDNAPILLCGQYAFNVPWHVYRSY